MDRTLLPSLGIVAGIMTLAYYVGGSKEVRWAESHSAEEIESGIEDKGGMIPFANPGRMQNYFKDTDWKSKDYPYEKRVVFDNKTKWCENCGELDDSDEDAWNHYQFVLKQKNSTQPVMRYISGGNCEGCGTALCQNCIDGDTSGNYNPLFNPMCDECLYPFCRECKSEDGDRCNNCEEEYQANVCDCCGHVHHAESFGAEGIREREYTAKGDYKELKGVSAEGYYFTIVNSGRDSPYALLHDSRSWNKNKNDRKLPLKRESHDEWLARCESSGSLTRFPDNWCMDCASNLDACNCDEDYYAESFEAQEAFKPDSNFVAIKKLEKNWKENHSDATWDERLRVEIGRLRDRLIMKGYDPNAKIGSPYYAESFGAESFSEAGLELRKAGRCGCDQDDVWEVVNVESPVFLCGSCGYAGNKKEMGHFGAESFSAEPSTKIPGYAALPFKGFRVAYEHDDEIIKYYDNLREIVSDFNEGHILDTDTGYLRIEFRPVKKLGAESFSAEPSTKIPVVKIYGENGAIVIGHGVRQYLIQEIKYAYEAGDYDLAFLSAFSIPGLQKKSTQELVDILDHYLKEQDDGGASLEYHDMDGWVGWQIPDFRRE